MWYFLHWLLSIFWVPLLKIRKAATRFSKTKVVFVLEVSLYCTRSEEVQLHKNEEISNEKLHFLCSVLHCSRYSLQDFMQRQIYCRNVPFYFWFDVCPFNKNLMESFMDIAYLAIGYSNYFSQFTNQLIIRMISLRFDTRVQIPPVNLLAVLNIKYILENITRYFHSNCG